MTASYALTLAFAAFLLAGLVVKFWLASRQIRYVAQHRDSVPPAFAGTITLAAHHKAADYTVAKTRFGLLELAIGAAILLGWTLLGGLDALNRALLERLGSGMAQQLALIVCFALIRVYRPAFPRSTRRRHRRALRLQQDELQLWLVDLVKSTALGAAIGLPIAPLSSG